MTQEKEEKSGPSLIMGSNDRIGITPYPLLCALLLAFTVLSRFFALGDRPPHHDESMNAFYSLQFLEKGLYRYTPFLEGPFPSHGTSLMFALFNESTAASRYLSAFLGVGCVALVLFLSPFISRPGAFLAATFLALSPTAMYFNRFAREDSPYVFGLLATLVFFLYFFRSRQVWMLWLSAFGFSIAYCSDSSIISALVALWGYLILRYFFLSDIEKGPLEKRFEFDLPTVVGPIWIFVLSSCLLFTGFFQLGTHFQSIVQSFTGPLGHWWDQLRNPRFFSPFYYYFLQLLAYEPFLLLLTALASAKYLLFDRKHLPLFLIFWFWALLFFYSTMNERMPWQTLHLTLPATLLAGCFLGDLWDSKPKATGPPWPKFLTILLVVFGLSYSSFTSIRLNFLRSADPAESYVYVQSSTDCLEVERIIRKVDASESPGHSTTLTIQDSCSWPYAWLLRDFEKRNHPTKIAQLDAPIILSAAEFDKEVVPLLAKNGYIQRKYKLRVWWVPSWFKNTHGERNMGPADLRDWIFGNFLPLGPTRKDMVQWEDLWKWVWHREIWSDPGSYDMRLWIRGDLARKHSFKGDSLRDIPARDPKATP